MDTKYYKKVLLPILVAEGDYCFGNGICCEHFSNEGGYLQCNLNLEFRGDTELKYNKDGMVTKLKYCKNLKESLDEK